MSGLLSAASAGVVSFLSLAVFAPDPMRFVDEADNLLGAMVIASGGHVYVDYFTHHMPGMYFLSLPAALMQVSDPLAFRLYFYAIVSLLFGLIALRSSDIVGRISVVTLPLIYALGLAANSTGASFAVLAEHLSAIGTIALLFEVLRAVRLETISAPSWLLIMVVSVTSLWFSFTAVYATATLVATLVLLWLISWRKGSLQESWARASRWAAAGLALTLFPIVLLQSLQGGLGPAFHAAFSFNTQVYSKYIGDFSQTWFTPVYKAVFNASQFFTPDQGNWPPNSTNDVAAISLVVVNVVFLVWLWRRSHVASVMIAMATILTMVRGMRDIHAIPYWGISTAMSAVLIGVLLRAPRQHSAAGNLWRVATVGVLLVTLGIPYAADRAAPVLMGRVSWSSPWSEKDRVTAGRVPTGEHYADMTSDLWGYIRTGRLPATRTAIIFPWTMEWKEAEVLRDLDIKRPRVIIHDPELEVWGYRIRDFAPAVNEYILRHYTSAESVASADGSSPSVWVRNP